jgi:hypothetical protein
MSSTLFTFVVCTGLSVSALAQATTVPAPSAPETELVKEGVEVTTSTPRVEGSNDATASTVAARSKPITTSYAQQTVLADVAAAAVVYVPMAVSSVGDDTRNDGRVVGVAPIVWGIGLGTYLIGAPVVHLANGFPARAALSLGMRAGAISLVETAGPALLNGCAKWSANYVTDVLCISLLISGAVVAMAAPPAIDAATARKQLSPPPQAAHAHWAPTFAVVRGGATAGLQGEF